MKINIVTKGKFKDNSYIYQIVVEIDVEKIPSKWVVSIEKYLSLPKVILFKEIILWRLKIILNLIKIKQLLFL